MQRPVNEHDIKLTVWGERRNVGDMAFNLQVLAPRRFIQVANSVWRNINADDAMPEARNEQRIATLSASNIQNTKWRAFQFLKNVTNTLVGSPSAFGVV